MTPQRSPLVRLAAAAIFALCVIAAGACILLLHGVASAVGAVVFAAIAGTVAITSTSDNGDGFE